MREEVPAGRSIRCDAAPLIDLIVHKQDTLVHDIVRLYRDLQRDETGEAPAVAAGVSGHWPS